MDFASKSAFVRLRLRIVKIKGPETKVKSNITVLAAKSFFQLAPKECEWRILELDSLDEKITFQTAFGNASCKCRDLDGRRRFDFSHDFSILVEAYWVLVFPEPTVLKPDGPSVTQTTRNCEIHFTATKGTPGYDPLNDFVSSFGRATSEVDELEELVESDKGPVARAMQWLKETTFTLPDQESKIPLSNRLTYEPSKEPEKVKWSPEITAMKKRNTRMDVLMQPADTETQLAGILRNVNIALNLKSVYI
jgi:hypothetical protein